MKKLTFLPLVVSILLLFSFFSGSNATTPANIEPGDTFVYNISTWDVPWKELIPPEEAPFDLEAFVLDLSGSTLGVKVMDTYSNGYYLLDFYVILGKTIVIPLPDDTPQEVIDIIGPQFNLEKGIGIGIGSLPGTDFIAMLDETEDAGGVPFYLNPTEWNRYADELSNLSSSEVTVTITNEAGSDFSVKIDGTTPDGVNIVVTAVWFREGENPGVFKSITGTVDGDITGDGISNHLELALTFTEKQQNPLPPEITNLNDIVVSLPTAEMTYSITGFSTATNDQIDDALTYAQDFINDLNGVNVLKYDVEATTGCYYRTRIEVYDPEQAQLVETVSELWWNGFTGFPVYEDTYSITPYDAWSPSVALIPLGAPGITPDWDMWSASTHSISGIVEILEKSLESFFTEESVTDLGIDLNNYDTLYQLRESGNIMFFYSEGKLDIEFHANQMQEMPPELQSTSKLSLTIDTNSWIAYTKEGLLAGAGEDIVAALTVTDIPFDGSTPETGSVNLEIQLEARSDRVSSIPDPVKASPFGEESPGLTPGFEFIIPLAVMVIVVSFSKKRK